MKIQWDRFNIYLFLALGLALVWGCSTPEEKHEKALSTIRFHLEVAVNSAGTNSAGTLGGYNAVPIYRDNPVMVNIEAAPFITEANVAEAKVVETVGGFGIGIRLDRRGTWLYEQYTIANHGKRFAIFSLFANPLHPEFTVSRWLAAPYISRRVSDGYILFTPDASREEAYQIVLGLNNAAKKHDKEADQY